MRNHGYALSESDSGESALLLWIIDYNIPNDDSIKLANQYFLNNIEAFAGWDVDSGDTNVIIGIVDSGTDWDHPDLQDNIFLGC